MRRGRVFIYLGLILILALVAVWAVFLRAPGTPQLPVDTGGVTQPQVEEQPTTDVIITTQRVSRGEEIDEGVIQVVGIPQNRVISGMFTTPADVIGTLAKFDLEPGVFLTEGMVVDFGDELGPSGSDAALLIDPGMVAVSIPVDRLSSVSYGLRRGDHVNVIVTMLFVDLDPSFQSILPNNSSAVIAPGPAVLLTITSGEEGAESTSTSLSSDELLQTLTAQIATGGLVSPIGRLELDPTLGQPFYLVPSESQRPRSVSQTLIQNAMVLQLGNFSLQDTVPVQPTPTPLPEGQLSEEEAAAQPPPAAPAPEIPDVITLVVSPQDAVTLNYLILNNARLSLAMRSAQDDTRVQTESVTLQFLLDQYDIPIPAKLPFGLEPRLDSLQPLAPPVNNTSSEEGQ